MPLDNVPTDPAVPEDVLPAGELPPLRYRELPEPIPIRKMIGPSVILAGLALGSGEFVIWPYITYQSGFIFFWACLLGVATQYFLNLEIIRWSLATGESAVTGFTRLSRHWAWIFLFLNIVPWMVPAWATGAAQLISWLGWGVDGDPLASPYVTHLAVASLFACGIVLTAGKVVYETVEKVQFVLVALVLVLVVVLAFWLVVAEGRGDAVAAQLQGAVNFGAVPDFTEQLTPAVLLGALAFAGVGGTLNLGQSNYVKDKGYGMGKYIGRITSPITGQEEAMSEVGYHFPHTPENLQRWRRWWRSARTEHFLTFFLTCVVCLILLTLVSYCLFYNPDGTPNAHVGQYEKGGMSFVWGEAVELERLLGPTVKVLFLLMGVAILLTTEFGVLDAATRVSTDIVKVSWLRDSSRWTESRLYYVFLWGLILLGTLILLDPKQRISAFGLFKFSAAMNGGVMFIYSGLLLYLNRFKLPSAVRMGWAQVLILTWSTLFFGYFSFMTLKGLLF
jgi:hypothetical protein